MKLFLDLSLLRHNRNFSLLSLGQFVSFMGTMITGVALPYQVYQMTHSVLMIGLLSLLQLLPLLITALLGGALADRYHRKLLLIITESALTFGSAVLAFNAFSSSPQLWLIFTVAILMSAVNGLHRPALTSLNQQLLSGNDFAAAGSIRAFISSTTMIIGPAVGGLIIAHFGLFAAFVADSFSFLISLVALLLITNIPAPVAKRDDSVLKSIIEGFRYSLSRQELVGTYVVDFVAMIFGMPLALFPALAPLYGGVKTLGLFYSAPAVGAVCVSFLSGWVKSVKRHGLAVAIAAALWGIAIIFFGLVHYLWHNLWLALFFLSLAGAFDSVSAIFRGIMWNETVASNFRGRLAGIEMISYLSGPKLGDTESGLIAAAFGITASIISGGILCVLGVALSCYFLPKFWNYRSNYSK